MPDAWGQGSWVGAQYQKFLDGWSKVGAQETKPFLRGASGQNEGNGYSPQITVPGFSDIIKTGAPPTVTAADKATQRAFEKAGLPSPLDPAIQARIAEQRDIADRIANSATPDMAQAFAQMMTAIDNVQDAAITISVAGRIGLRLAGRVGLRFVPILGPIIWAADALALINMGVAWLGAAYGFACGGPRQGIPAAITAAMMGNPFKGLSRIPARRIGLPVPVPTPRSKGSRGSGMFNQTNGRKASAGRLPRWGAVRPSFAEAVQAAQFSADTIGYGIGLGGIMGFMSESIYGAALAASGEPVRLRSPAVNHALREMAWPLVRERGLGSLRHHELSARVVSACWQLLLHPDLVGDELYALTWLTLYASIEPMAWDLNQLDWPSLLPLVDEARWEPYDVRDDLVAAQLEELGWPAREPGRFAGPQPGPGITAAELFHVIGPNVVAALQRWLAVDPLDPLRALVSTISIQYAERVWMLAEGDANFWRWELAPGAAITEAMMLASRWPAAGDPPELIMAAWRATEQAMEQRGRKMLTGPELDRIWESCGTPLIRLVPGLDTMPPEWFVPHDPTTGVPDQLAWAPDIDGARKMLTQQLAALRAGDSAELGPRGLRDDPGHVHAPG